MRCTRIWYFHILGYVYNVVLNNVMLPILLVKGVFGLLFCHSCCMLWDKIQNHRMNMPFLPSGRTLSVSPILSYCSSHTSRICTLLPPSMLPSIFVGFGMSVIWVHSWYCLSGRLSSRTSFWFNSMVCIWTRQTSVNMVKTESSSSAVEIIIALFDSPTFSEITGTSILWVFTVYCLYLLKHSLDSSFFFFKSVCF